MFELLFKYSRETFARAELVFASGWPFWLLLALVGFAVLGVTVTLLKRRAGLHPGRTAVVGLLQAGLIALLLTLAWRPALVTQTLRPQENAVAVLVDTSASMLYGDGDQSRLKEAIEGLTARALPELESAFEVGLFAFAGETVELPSLEQVPAPGAMTRIGDALLDVLRGAGAGSIAAVVLVSDGADNSGELDPARIAEIASFGVPVHTVGVGAETMPGDLELDDVQIAPVGLAGSTVSAQVSIRHDGRGLAALKVYDGDAILATEAIELPASTGVTSRAIDIDVGEPGVRDLRFALDALPDETNVVNNTRWRSMDVPEQRRTVLYLEGEPRWEYKFIGRAVEDETAIRFVRFLKTTPNKNFRQGLDDPAEVEDGLPAEERTLFEYDALIIGSFEAAAFTPAQHDLIREFVSRRGGSLLMLGGRRGLADGGWGATSVAEALPVTLPSVDGPTFFRLPAQAVLTDAGRRSAVTHLDADEQRNVALWEEMPALADFQHPGVPKAAAEVLLEADADGRREPLLVQQRFGAGHAFVLSTGGTWRWQMQLPHEDQRHETFWRQLLQALAMAAPRKVTLTTDRPFYGDEADVRLRADVRDPSFKPAADATVEVEVSDGRGAPATLAMTPVAGEPGVYEAGYAAAQPGIYRFTARARVADEALGEATAVVRREDGVSEHFRIQQNRALLERIAAATGGRYFTIDALAGLPEAVRFSEAGIVERQVLELWNMPIVFLLLLLLKGGEWLLRLYWGRL